LGLISIVVMLQDLLFMYRSTYGPHTLSKLHQAFDIILGFEILGVGKVVLNVRFFVGSL